MEKSRDNLPTYEIEGKNGDKDGQYSVDSFQEWTGGIRDPD